MLGQRVRKLKLRREAKRELVAAMATEPGALPGVVPERESSGVTWPAPPPGRGRLAETDPLQLL